MVKVRVSIATPDRFVFRIVRVEMLVRDLSKGMQGVGFTFTKSRRVYPAQEIFHGVLGILPSLRFVDRIRFQMHSISMILILNKCVVSNDVADPVSHHKFSNITL